jgi:hypothetical protein
MSPSPAMAQADTQATARGAIFMLSSSICGNSSAASRRPPARLRERRLPHRRGRACTMYTDCPRRDLTRLKKTIVLIEL